MTGRRIGDAHHLLLRALHRRAGGPGGVEIGTATTEGWASATFRGARHKVVLRLTGEGASDRASALSQDVGTIEFSLPGHLVADIAVIARHQMPEGVAIEIEALTVEDA